MNSLPHFFKEDKKRTIMKNMEDYIRSIPDFPEEGIIFRDVTSVLQDPDGLALAIDSMKKMLEGIDFDLVVGTESRGFIFGVQIGRAHV